MKRARLLIFAMVGCGGPQESARVAPAGSPTPLPSVERRAAPVVEAPAAQTPKIQPPPSVPARAEPTERDLLAPLDSALRSSAEQWLVEQRARGEELVKLLEVRIWQQQNAASLLVTLEPPDAPEISRRVYGLITRDPAGAQTLDMPSEPCGTLEEPLFDLHGDGARFAIFLEVGGGYHCSLAGQTVAYELVGDQWKESTAPAMPSTSGEDLDGDGKPDFTTSVMTYNLGDCTYAACGDYFFRVDIMGYESWDGRQFSSSGGHYKAYYEEQYRELASGAKQLGPINGCESNRLREGVRAFGYALLSGRKRAEAMALARRYFRGVKVDDCKDEGVLYPIAKIEADLLASQSRLEALR